MATTGSPTSPSARYDTGDVFGRAYVRWREVQASAEFLLRACSGTGRHAQKGRPRDRDQSPPGRLRSRCPDGFPRRGLARRDLPRGHYGR